MEWNFKTNKKIIIKKFQFPIKSVVGLCGFLPLFCSESGDFSCIIVIALFFSFLSGTYSGVKPADPDYSQYSSSSSGGGGGTNTSGMGVVKK